MTAPDNGCEFGRLLRQAFDLYCKRYDSKVEGIDTLICAWRDIKFPKFEKQIAEVNHMLADVLHETGQARAGAERAEKTARAVKKDFDGLYSKIFFTIIGSTVISGSVLMAVVVLVYKILGGQL